jgi:carbamate kinase
VLTHGNGPQVGNILLQNELCEKYVPSMPLDVCVSESQGQIGYIIQQTLLNKLMKLKIDGNVVCLITQVIVDMNDSAFTNPTKPIGPYYNSGEMESLAYRKNWKFSRDVVRGGWRRVVPSPTPIGVVEKNIIRQLVLNGVIVIAVGGGGIPVAKINNEYVGVDAVVDKDLASALLGKELNATILIMLTDVERVALDFGLDTQKELDRLTLEDARKYLRNGQFPSGSMGPKIEAAIYFLESGGEKVIITKPECLGDALCGRTGTVIL